MKHSWVSIFARLGLPHSPKFLFVPASEWSDMCLLSEDKSVDRCFKFVTRETELIVGVLPVLVGLGVAASSVVS